MSGPGKISWFNDATTASGISAATYPGIAVLDQATLGGYWLVHMPNGRQAVVKQIDIGPATWTGRLYDFSAPAVRALGYTTSNFPTDAVANATYLGKTVPAAYASMVLGQGGSAHSGSAGTPAASATSSTASTASGAAAASASGCLLSVCLTGVIGALLTKNARIWMSWPGHLPKRVYFTRNSRVAKGRMRGR